MAVVVEISKTQHLAFSPLNEQHNLLYNKARRILNQRFIQKPWFDMHPFLDEADKKDQDLETFVPDDFKGFQPLQSLCIVEDYFSDRPTYTREFGIGEFWDFLFSNSWSEGYSIRVLEGALHKMLVSTLVGLIKNGYVVQHSTFAYAKNIRTRTSAYRHTKASKNQNLNCAEETLLLEFIYYGRAVHRDADDDTSVGYPESSTTFPWSISEEIESSEHEYQGDQTASVSTIKQKLQDVRPPLDVDKYAKVQQKQFRRRMLCTKHEQDIVAKSSEVNQTLSRETMNRSLSRQTVRRQSSDETADLPIIQHQEGKPPAILRQETLSNFSSGSDYRHAPPKVDLKKFMCTQRATYLGEFDLGSEESSESEDEHYGQEFYLGDLRTTEKNESVEMMLKRRKEIVTKKRADWKKELNEYTRRKSILPKLSTLDVSKYLSDETLKKSSEKRMTVEKVPDLDEFIKMMNEEDRYKYPKASAERNKFISFALKYKLIKPDYERFGDEVGGVTDSIACKLYCYERDPAWAGLSESAKRNYLAAKLEKMGGKVKTKKKKKLKHKKPDPVVVPLISITNTSGITYLHPVSKGILQRQIQIKEKKKQEMDKKKKKTPSEEGSAKDAGTEKPMFPKVSLVTGEESPDTDTDESDGLSGSPFDTKKLNRKYSIEKLRSKRVKKKKRAGKFHSILKKYCRMQSIIKAFTPKPSVSRRRSPLPTRPSYHTSPTRKPKKKPVKLIGLLLPKVQVEDEKVKDTITVGKLKRFRFLEAKEKTKHKEEDQTVEPLSGAYSLEDFRVNVERSLEEFVVRKEIVVSDMGSKPSVSITFTKKSVFKGSRFLNAGT